VTGNNVLKAEAINFLNPDKPITVNGNAVSWRSVTTGNFAGVDLWLENADAGEIRIDTDVASGVFRIGDLGLEDRTIEAGGLGKRIRAFRLPDGGVKSPFAFTHPFRAAAGERDTALYVRVTQEDGHQAWSSPIYFIR
jgi:hypothetical protein